MIEGIINLENEALTVKIEDHFEKCTDDEGLKEALEHMNIRLKEIGFSGPKGEGALRKYGGILGNGVASTLVSQYAQRSAAVVVGGAVAGAVFAVASVAYYGHKSAWSRSTATKEIAQEMKKELRWRTDTYAGVARRSFRKLGKNAYFYSLGALYKQN